MGTSRSAVYPTGRSPEPPRGPSAKGNFMPEDVIKRLLR